MSHPSQWLILCVWLWSEMIGPEFPPKGSEEPTVAVATPSPTQLQPATSRLDLKTAAMDKAEPIDAQAFSVAFKRQAKNGLIPCLQQNRPGPGSFMMSAQLEKSGRLRLIRSMDQATVPDCAVNLIESMDFQALTSLMDAESQNVQWRLDY